MIPLPQKLPGSKISPQPQGNVGQCTSLPYCESCTTHPCRQQHSNIQQISISCRTWWIQLWSRHGIGCITDARHHIRDNPVECPWYLNMRVSVWEFPSAAMLRAFRTMLLLRFAALLWHYPCCGAEPRRGLLYYWHVPYIHRMGLQWGMNLWLVSLGPKTFPSERKTSPLRRHPAWPFDGAK